jgi:RNA polymerase sigma-70 factor, ECF subfamily
MPAGRLNAKVQPAWRERYRAEPASTQGEAPDPDTAVQRRLEGLQYWARKRMYIRCRSPLPGMLARTPILAGEPFERQEFTVAQSRLERAEELACGEPVGGEGAACAGSANVAARAAAARGGRTIRRTPVCIGPRASRLELDRLVGVTDREPVRSTGMNDAVAERVPLAARTGAESFESLYERTFPKVYAYVASLLRDRSAAEDVTAQAFERAYRKRRSYRRSRGSVEAWLFGIARNAALDELRRRRRRASLETEPEDTGLRPPEEDAELALRRETVRAALAGLSGPERDLVALKFAGGLSNAEIARVLGLSESNVGTRLHRTLTKLREACHEDA